MSVSAESKILGVLRENKRVSGQYLAQNLGISRTAVWKHIKSLRAQGYVIQARTRLGYSLEKAPDRLLCQEINSGLHTEILGQSLYCYQEVDSTQKVAEGLALKGHKEGSSVVAEKQTAARGRMNRKWHTPDGSVSISVVLRPEIEPSKAGRLVLLAGVAAADAIEKTTCLKPELKWPNDIIINKKKAGGILTEMSAETDRVGYIILGIGVNVNCTARDFPDNIRPGSTSLAIEAGSEISGNTFIAELLKSLEEAYLNSITQGFGIIRERWVKINNTLGRPVRVVRFHDTVQGIAVDINDDGALVLNTIDRGRIAVHSGDVFFEGNSA